MSAAAVPQTPRRVVVVEDSDAVRRSLMLLLRTRGYVVEGFRSGVELLSSGRIEEPDCFIIDYILPRMDGLELYARLREIGMKAAAIMITGCTTPHLTQKALNAGFVTVIDKPPERLSLIREIEAAIARPAT